MPSVYGCSVKKWLRFLLISANKTSAKKQKKLPQATSGNFLIKTNVRKVTNG